MRKGKKRKEKRIKGVNVSRCHEEASNAFLQSDLRLNKDPSEGEGRR